LLQNNYNLVITHGNGPQVGNILLANKAGQIYNGMPEMPLDICVAYSQGFIGYMIEQQLRNVLRQHEMDRDIISIITQVLVTKDDPAFKNPTKPIGPYYTKEESDKIAADTGSKFAKDPQGRGYRKVVASPKPLVISNVDTIRKISREGQIVIAVGGGGIPAYYAAENELRGIDAVIDKDLASALMASQINADKFFILTDVPKVYLNFNTPQQKAALYRPFIARSGDGLAFHERLEIGLPIYRHELLGRPLGENEVAQATQIGEFGGCTHSLSEPPCMKGGDCLTCSEKKYIKGTLGCLDRLREAAVHHKAQFDALDAWQKKRDQFGVDQWMTFHVIRYAVAESLVRQLEDPEIPNGAVLGVDEHFDPSPLKVNLMAKGIDIPEQSRDRVISEINDLFGFVDDA